MESSEILKRSKHRIRFSNKNMDFNLNWALGASDLVGRPDVPGTELKDIDISLHGNVLTIKSERKRKEGDDLRREIAYGVFERRLRFPRPSRPTRSRRSSKTGAL